jgi:hypothetical protein
MQILLHVIKVQGVESDAEERREGNKSVKI